MLSLNALDEKIFYSLEIIYEVNMIEVMFCRLKRFALSFTVFMLNPVEFMVHIQGREEVELNMRFSIF